MNEIIDKSLQKGDDVFKRVVLMGIVIGVLQFLLKEFIFYLFDFGEFSMRNFLIELILSIVVWVVFVAFFVIIMKEDQRRQRAK